MHRKLAAIVFLMLILGGMFGGSLHVQEVEAGGTIRIRANGSVDPPTANISTLDNVTYTFTDNNYDSIVIERDNIVVDGAGYILQGPGEEVPDSKGIDLTGTINVTIRNMAVESFYYGIYLYNSSKNTMNGNTITNNFDGIYLISSENNTISGNDVANNENGVAFNYSPNNFLQSNLFNNNYYGFGFLGLELSHFMQSIDTSNLVDGKPVYYLIGKNGLSITPSTHPTVGFLALINSVNMAVEGLMLTKNRLGLLIAYTHNTKIHNNTVIDNLRGIVLNHSSNDTVSGNNIMLNGAGVWLDTSSNNTITGNAIEINTYGIELDTSSCNAIYGNTVENNMYGFALSGSSGNRIYHNTVVDNTQQVLIQTVGYVNSWDDGYPSGGNYWSDYPGVDLCSGLYQNESDHDWIGDSPYVINEANKDNYPLVAPYVPEIHATQVASIYRQLLGRYNELLSLFSNLTSTYNELSSLFSNLTSTYSDLKSKQEATATELTNIKSLMYIFIITTITFIATTVYLATRKPKVKPESKT